MGVVRSLTRARELFPPLANALSEGEATLLRGECTTTGVTLTSKTLRLGPLAASKTEAIKHLRVVTTSAGGYTAGGAPSKVLLGAYSVSTIGALTLLAKTANTTSALKENGELYEVALEATWEKVAGQRYMLGILVVTTGTVPIIAGNSSSLSAAEMAKLPHFSAGQTGLEELPETIAAGSVVGSSATPYIVAAP